MKVAAFLSVFACAASFVAACTVFDGLEAEDGGPVDVDSGSETAPPPEAGSDADAGGGDAGNYPGFLSLQDAIKLCTNIFKCPNLGGSLSGSVDIPADALNYSSCVGWMAGPIPPDRIGIAKAAANLTCAANAKTCAEAGACFWYDQIDPTDPRCAGVDAGANRVCANGGNDVVDCQYDFVLHCQNNYYQSGSVCTKGADGVHWCATSAKCTFPNPGMCMGSFDQYCGGSSNLPNSEDCNLTGMSCGFDTGSGFYQCLTNGVYKPCSTVGVTCTSGTTVNLCDGANESHFDCATFGGTCDDTAMPRCKRPIDTCTPLDPTVNTCAGDVVSLCVGGQPATFDCTKVGTKCVPGTGGQTPHCG